MTVIDAPPEVPAEPERARRRWPWVALAALAVAGAAAGLVVLLGEDDEPAAPDVTSELPDLLDSATDPDTVELAELLADGRAATYHATYSTSGALAGVEGTSLEVWRSGGRLRQDTTATIEGQEVRTASFLEDGEAVVCSSTQASAWSCSASEPAGTEGDGVFGSVHDQLAGSDVTSRSAELNGEPVRCFAFSGATGTGELCVTTQGVPASIVLGDVRIELVSIEDDVPGDVFDPPAEPVAAEAAG